MSEGLLTTSRLRLQLLDQKILSAADRRLAAINEKLARLDHEVWQIVTKYIEKQKLIIEKLDKVKSLLDPVQVMKLGYSVTKSRGRVIRDAVGLKKGDLIETTLFKGSLNSTVSGIQAGDE